jgi:hypothetical protein
MANHAYIPELERKSLGIKLGRGITREKEAKMKR